MQCLSFFLFFLLGLFCQFVAQSWEELVTKHLEWTLRCTPALLPGRPEDVCFFRGAAVCVTALRDLLLFSVHRHAGRGFVFKHLLGSLLVLRPRHPMASVALGRVLRSPRCSSPKAGERALARCLGLRAEERIPLQERRGWGTGGGRRGHLQAILQDGERMASPPYLWRRRQGREYGADRALLRRRWYGLAGGSPGTMTLCPIRWVGGGSTSIGSSASTGGSTSMGSTPSAAAAPTPLALLRLHFRSGSMNHLDPRRGGQLSPQDLFIPTIVGSRQSLGDQRLVGQAQGLL